SFNHEFFYNDHYLRLIKAEHSGNDRWYFYPFSMIGCMFPWSVYTLVSLVYLFKNLKRSASPIYIFLFSWICVIFIVFQFAHSKLVSYILPLFAALALVTGDFIYNTALFENMDRKFLIGSLITLFILLLIPAGLIVFMPGYSIYLSSKIPAYALVFLLLILAALFSIFLIRRKFFKATFLLAFVVPVVLLFVPFARKEIEPYLSSRAACEYLLTDDKLRDYLRGQAIAYCILKKSSVEDMERVAGKEFKITLLKIIGNEYILRVEPNYIDRGYRRE
ncbi:MAG: hypothetical protein NT066_01790, partial [Candidatus Omnitrophica bacterium]|nr:hypothetical protein [Candidatus Omnitrophota bacterium]